MVVRLPRVFDRVVGRLVGVTVLAGIVAAVIGAVLVGTVARSTLSAEIAELNLRAAQDLAIRLDSRIDSVTAGLRIAAAQTSIQRLEPTAEQELRAVRTAAGTYDELVLFDASGTPVAAAAGHFLADPSDYPPRPDLAAADGNGSVDVIDVFPPVLEVGVPVEFPPGTGRGTLVARIPLELVAAPIHQIDPTADGERFLVDRSGRFLVHPSRDLVAEARRFPVEAAMEAMEAGEIMTLGGEEFVVAVAPTERLEGAVVVLSNRRVALAPVRDQLRDISLIVVAVIAAVVVAVILAGRQLLNPLKALSEAVGRFGTGEQGVRAPVPKGELGAVAGEFNRMADRLERRRDELAYMHDLSVLVTSSPDRATVVSDMVEGVGRLLDAERVVFLEVETEGSPRIQVTDGADDALADIADTAERSLTTRRIEVTTSRDSTTIVAVPVAAREGDISGVLALVRGDRPPDEEELRLAETFSFFAAAALENVRRLELERFLANELQQILDQRRDLMSNISHDLRAPVVSIQKFTSRLESRWGAIEEEAAAGILSDIREEARTLDRLIGTLLEFTATERGPTAVNLAPVRVHAVVTAAVEALAPLLGDRPMEVAVSGEEAMADFSLLRRTLIHLLSNAIRFSPAGSPIVVRSHLRGATVRIEVEDRGMGLTEEEAELIFVPFWRRASRARDPSGRGMGLGLSLAADYVQAMGGTLGVEATPSRGSIFYIILPVESRTAQSHVGDSSGRDRA